MDKTKMVTDRKADRPIPATARREKAELPKSNILRNFCCLDHVLGNL